VVLEAARVLGCFEQWDESIEAYKLAIKADPISSDDWSVELGRTYESAGRPNEAVAVYRDIIANESSSAKGLAKRYLAELLPRLR
jgi:tetratricopeptide (TPR) repeat protein